MNIEEYDNKLKAYEKVLEEFITTISILRQNSSIIESTKLETIIQQDKRGVITEYRFIGKIKFPEDLNIEEEEYLNNRESYTTVLKYNLKYKEIKPSEKEQKKQKRNSNKNYVWILKKIN